MPIIITVGFKPLAWTLTSFLVIAGIIGVLGAPRNAGKSLEEIQYERHHVVPRPVAASTEPGASRA